MPLRYGPGRAEQSGFSRARPEACGQDRQVSHGRYVTFQLAEVRGVAADVQGYPDADCPVAGAACTRVRGAAIGQSNEFHHREADNIASAAYDTPSWPELFAIDA
jgi:hypothetical protein